MNGRVWGRWFVLKRTDSMAYGYTSGAVSSATSDWLEASSLFDTIHNRSDAAGP